MHLSLSISCHLCGGGQGVSCLTSLNSDKGKEENLELLINRYIQPVLALPKDVNLCVCDSCKSRLQAWHAFIELCKEAQVRLFTSSVKTQTTGPVDPDSKKRHIDTPCVSNASTVGSVTKKKRSSNYCIARWCNQGNFQGVSLFRLPRDRDRALVWLSSADRDDLKRMATLHSYYLCAEHFTPNMFTNKACNQLIRGAVPTLFPKSPVANRIVNKRGTSLKFPTLLQGVQLKNILPKVIPSTSTSGLRNAKLAMGSPTKTVIKRSDSKITSNSIVFQLLPQVTIKSAPELNQHQPHSNVYFEVLPSELASRLQNLSSLPSAPGSEPLVEADNVQIQNHGACASSSGISNNACKAGTKLEGENIPKQGKKLVLEGIESCFSANGFGSSHLVSADTITEGGSSENASKEDDALVDGQMCSSTLCEDLDSQLPPQIGKETYQSIVGSQDFLLPHVSEKAGKPFSPIEISFPLRSDSSPSLHTITRDNNAMLCNANESNSAGIGLYDLRVDDIQGTSNTSFINMENLDELMDLDQYFTR